MAEVEAGDLKEFVDELLQTLRLVQGDAGVAGAQLRGELGLVTEQCQIADDAGEGGLQVVGHVGDQLYLHPFAAGLLCQGRCRPAWMSFSCSAV